jgi:hypothetical protein
MLPNSDDAAAKTIADERIERPGKWNDAVVPECNVDRLWRGAPQ